MNPILIGCIFAVCVIGSGVYFFLVERNNQKKKRHILENGVTIYAFIVQVNSDAFTPNFYDAPAQIVFSFAPDTPELREHMDDIGARMAALKAGSADDETSRYVASLVRDEVYRPERRDLLPPSFTGGIEVYAGNVAIRQYFLPDGYLTRSYVLCKAIPGESGLVIMIRYPDFPEGSKQK